MAIQHMDNFTPYGIGGQARMLDGVFAYIGNFSSVTLVEDPDPIVTGPVLRIGSGSGQSSDTRFVLSTTQTTVGMAHRIWLEALPNNTGMTPRTMQFRDASNGTIVYTVVTTTGAIELRAGNGTLLGSTTGPVVTANAWWHLEGRFTGFGGSAGVFELRVEGVTVMNVSAITTSLPCAQVCSSAEGFATTYIKDYVVYDGSGGNNTGFLGSVVVAPLTPMSDVLTGWTPSTGTLHYALVDNSPPLDSTEYVTAPFPVPTPDQYGLTNLPDDVTSIRAIMTMVRARKTDGGDGNLQVSMVSGASVGNGADRPITAAFTYWRDVFPTDPATGAAWLPGAVDAAQLRINRTL